MNEYERQLALSTVYKQYPNVTRNVRTTRYTAKDTEDVFYYTECNRKVKLAEVLRFTETNPDRYVIFLCNFRPDSVGYASLKYTYAFFGSNTEGNVTVGHYYSLSERILSFYEAGLYSNFSSTSSPVLGLSHWDDPNFYYLHNDFYPSHGSMLEIIDPMSYDDDLLWYITLDVKSLYKIALTREQCIDHFGKIFAKLYVLKQFMSIINAFEQYEYGALIVNSYIADNASNLNIDFDKILLLRFEFEFGESSEIAVQHIINTAPERERIIQAIKDAIDKF